MHCWLLTVSKVIQNCDWPLNCFNVFGRLVCNMKGVTQIENVGKTNAKWSQGEVQIGPGRPLFANLWVTSYLPGHTWRVTITFALFLFGLMKWSEYKLMKMWHTRETQFGDFSACSVQFFAKFHTAPTKTRIQNIVLFQISGRWKMKEGCSR